MFDSWHRMWYGGQEPPHTSKYRWLKVLWLSTRRRTLSRAIEAQTTHRTQKSLDQHSRGGAWSRSGEVGYDGRVTAPGGVHHIHSWETGVMSGWPSLRHCRRLTRQLFIDLSYVVVCLVPLWLVVRRPTCVLGIEKW